MEFGPVKHLIRQRLRRTRTVAMRPWLEYRRDRNLETYLEERRRSGKPAGLHVGSNDELLPGWFNCDIDTVGGQLNYLNAAKPLPFAAGTFDYVFSEHFLEHLSYEQGGAFLTEARRVLRPGGVIRTAIPDLAFALDLYAQRTPLHRRYVEWYVKAFLPGRPESPVPVINTLFYGFGHRFIYDGALLEQRLREAGFRETKVLKPGESFHEFLRGVERHGRVVPAEFNELETVVVEAW